MENVALGTVVFMREDKLADELLPSVPAEIDDVYVADTGEMTPEKTDVYAADYPFELHLLDLEYDAGLGAGRKKIVDEMDEEFLLLADPDVRIPSNVDTMYRQLRAEPSLGGIGGALAEPDRVFAPACDLFDDDGTMTKDIREIKAVEWVEGAPLVRFDFVSNMALFRHECVSDYCWDPEIIVGREHVDFFTGHLRTTDWSFALSPSVIFRHLPGGSAEYESHRFSDTKTREAEDYYLDKWDLSALNRKHQDYIHSYNFSILHRAIRYYRANGLVTTIKRGIEYTVGFRF